MKTVSKILLIIMVMVATTVIVPNNTSKAAMAALNAVNANTEGQGKDKITDVVNTLLGFLQIASALIAVVMIAATGFRYIIETPEMKNELKKSMIPIIVGILLVFFAASIAKFFIGMFSSSNG